MSTYSTDGVYFARGATLRVHQIDKDRQAVFIDGRELRGVIRLSAAHGPMETVKVALEFMPGRIEYTYEASINETKKEELDGNTSD